MLSCALWRPSALQTSVSALASASACAPSASASRVAHRSSRQAQTAVRLSQRHRSSSASFSAQIPSGIYLRRKPCKSQGLLRLTCAGSRANIGVYSIRMQSRLAKRSVPSVMTGNYAFQQVCMPSGCHLCTGSRDINKRVARTWELL